MPSVETALCDSGPLVALFKPSDAAHSDCRESLDAFNGRLMTTWPVLTEVFYFLDSSSQQENLWKFILDGGLWIAELMTSELKRLRLLMGKYSDLPMDLADASLVVVAERLRLRKVFTLDRRDFRVYRPRHSRSFEIFP